MSLPHTLRPIMAAVCFNHSPLVLITSEMAGSLSYVSLNPHPGFISAQL